MKWLVFWTVVIGFLAGSISNFVRDNRFELNVYYSGVEK